MYKIIFLLNTQGVWVANYLLVPNLPFLGKVVERAAVEQFQLSWSHSSLAFTLATGCIQCWLSWQITSGDIWIKAAQRHCCFSVSQQHSTWLTTTYWPTALLMWEYSGQPYNGFHSFSKVRDRGVLLNLGDAPWMQFATGCNSLPDAIEYFFLWRNMIVWKGSFWLGYLYYFDLNLCSVQL